MKFLSVYLSNYIGIYNGMGLYDIHIDMSKCRNRITIIRGDNGSGKSTTIKMIKTVNIIMVEKRYLIKIF